MKQKTKSKGLMILNIILLLSLVTIPVYAYWASNVKAPDEVTDDTTITIGEGAEVTTTVEVTGSADSALDLVPVGREVAGQSVSSITFTFDVVWAGTSDATSAANATGDLSASAVLSGPGAAELALFTVSTYTTTRVTYGSTTPVSITVTFTHEPVDAAQYNLIANALLNLAVTFTVDGVTPNVAQAGIQLDY